MGCPQFGVDLQPLRYALYGIKIAVAQIVTLIQRNTTPETYTRGWSRTYEEKILRGAVTTSTIDIK